MTRTAGLAATGILILAGLASPATASPANEAEFNIVQLGDSYSSGNGAGAYYEENCSRSSANYGQQTADALASTGLFGAVTYTNAACGGAVSSDVYETQRYLGWKKSRTRTYILPKSQYPDQAAEWQRRVEAEQVCGTPPGENLVWEYRRVAPAPAGSLYTATAECHLRSDVQVNAVTPETDAVFLTIGGNDVGFARLVATCLVVRDAGSCEASVAAATDTYNNVLPQRLATTLNAIEEASAGNADVYLMNYPYLLNTDSYTLPDVEWLGSLSSHVSLGETYDIGRELQIFQDDYDRVQQAAVDAMNDATGSERYHFVDIKPAFTGHGLDPHFGASQAHSWIVPPVSNFSYSTYMHPTPAGWAAEAQVLTEFMADNAN